MVVPYMADGSSSQKKPLSAKDTVVFYSLVLLIILVESATVAILKKSVHNRAFAVLGVLGYALVALIFREILKFGSLGIANALWQSGSIFLISIISVVMYHDKFTHLEWGGIALSVVATVMVSWNGIEKMISQLRRLH